MRYSKGWGAALIVMLLLILDQALKIWIKTHMQLHESIEITPWFYLYFTENPGMAFGIEVIGKLFLSVFRIIAVSYTHLDVYKRQQLYKDAVKLLDRLVEMKAEYCKAVYGFFPANGDGDNIRVGAVSYTHLDVYKRQ